MLSPKLNALRSVSCPQPDAHPTHAQKSAENWIESTLNFLAKESRRQEGSDLKRANFPEALYRYRSLERLALILEELRSGARPHEG
jgi:hypothetical protein